MSLPREQASICGRFLPFVYLDGRIARSEVARVESEEEAPPVEASTSTGTRASRGSWKRRKLPVAKQADERMEQQRTSEAAETGVNEEEAPAGKSASRESSPCAQVIESEAAADENLGCEEEFNPGSSDEQNMLQSSSQRSSESSTSSAESRQKARSAQKKHRTAGRPALPKGKRIQVGRSTFVEVGWGLRPSVRVEDLRCADFSLLADPVWSNFEADPLDGNYHLCRSCKARLNTSNGSKKGLIKHMKAHERRDPWSNIAALKLWIVGMLVTVVRIPCNAFASLAFRVLFFMAGLGPINIKIARETTDKEAQ